MTVREAARALEVSESLVYKLCKEGRLGHHRIGLGRGAIRIDPEDVAELKRRAKVEGTPPAELPRREATTPAGRRVAIPDPFARIRRLKEEARKARG